VLVVPVEEQTVKEPETQTETTEEEKGPPEEQQSTNVEKNSDEDKMMVKKEPLPVDFERPEEGKAADAENEEGTKEEKEESTEQKKVRKERILARVEKYPRKSKVDQRWSPKLCSKKQLRK
jgi:hypothetical protein